MLASGHGGVATSPVPASRHGACTWPHGGHSRRLPVGYSHGSGTHSDSSSPFFSGCRLPPCTASLLLAGQRNSVMIRLPDVSKDKHAPLPVGSSASTWGQALPPALSGQVALPTTGKILAQPATATVLPLPSARPARPCFQTCDAPARGPTGQQAQGWSQADALGGSFERVSGAARDALAVGPRPP